MSLAIQTITTFLLLTTTVVCVYHLVLAFIAIVYRPRLAACGTPLHRFAIVIPAHNEEAVIAETLCCCAAFDYPAELVQVYVIADNCTDRTAAVAKAHSATCLVRTSEHSRGKGYALEWAFAQLANSSCDAYLVLDADCRISPNALRRCDVELAKGARVLQVNNRVANPDENAMAYLLAVANTLENDLFYAPKCALGLPAVLRRTGMIFRRDVLTSIPWQARSLAEDTEYGLRLLKAGIPVRFVADVHVTSPCPAAHHELTAQRSRWIGGSIQQARINSVGLAVAALVRRQPLFLDAAVTTWLVNRPLVVAQWLITSAAVGLCNLILPGAWTQVLNIALLAVTLGYCAYVLSGAIVLGVTMRRLHLMCLAPVEVVRYLGVALGVAFRGNPRHWTRTPRPAAVLDAADTH